MHLGTLFTPAWV